MRYRMPVERALLCVAIAISGSVVGCQRTAKKPDAHAQAEEAYAPVKGAVGFDILPLASSEDSTKWLAVFTDEGRSTKFRIEVGQATASEDKSAPTLGNGKFVSENGSDPLPLLDSLRQALEAKHLPTHADKVDELPFGYLLVGENQSRSSDGRFAATPAGNWTVLKVFLANDQAEVYLNLNPVIHKAEFSMKDAAYGDRVLLEMAKVL